MFPLYDFNIVCAAIATVSAAVGYRYTRGRPERRAGSLSRAFELRLPHYRLPRRRNSDASQLSSDLSVVSETDTSDGASVDCPTPESISDVTEAGTLKRKHREEDANSFELSHANLGSPSSCEPPRKRCRTPSSPEDVALTAKSGEVTVECRPSDGVFASASTSEPIVRGTENRMLKRKSSDDDESETDICAITAGEPTRKRSRTPTEPTEQIEPPKPASLAHVDQDLQENNDTASSPPTHASRQPTPLGSQPSVIVAPVSMTKFDAAKPQLTPAYTIPACKPSSAFTAFAGTPSVFAAAPQLGERKPAWCAGPNTPALALTAAAAPTSALHTATTDAPDDASASPPGETGQWVPAATMALGESAVEGDPLAAHAYTKSTHVGITGEEDEDVKAELKGAKLFVKRGDGEFSTGMLGHIKLLAHRTDGSERLVFRREPVWKVSMSVGLRPAVRCSFDEEQGVLRIALKEAVSHGGAVDASGKPQVVLYALKRGRVARPDFAAFAETVMQSSQLKASQT